MIGEVACVLWAHESNDSRSEISGIMSIVVRCSLIMIDISRFLKTAAGITGADAAYRLAEETEAHAVLFPLPRGRDKQGFNKAPISFKVFCRPRQVKLLRHCGTKFRGNMWKIINATL